MKALEDFSKLPGYQKMIAGALVVIIIFGVFWYFAYLPKSQKIASFKMDIQKIQNEIRVNETKARKLEELKKENDRLERELLVKQEQLPPEAEVNSLLKQISDLGLRVGLDFQLWRPSSKKKNSSGLYQEVPVDVEISGDYHTVATFFDRIGKLKRIVNIEDITMSSPRLEKDQVILRTRFVAMAFAAVPNQNAGPGDNQKSERR